MDEEEARHDHEVAIAATAWLSDPHNLDIYRRLLNAVERRSAYVQPQLPSADSPEVLDEVGADRPPEPLGQIAARVQKAMQEREHTRTGNNDVGP